MGTDSGTSLGRWQGYFEHVEMELMVSVHERRCRRWLPRRAMPPKRWRLMRNLARSSPANDFVVLSADPLADIRNTRTIESVWIDGRASTDAIRFNAEPEAETRKDPFSRILCALCVLCVDVVYCGNRPSAVSRSSRARWTTSCATAAAESSSRA